MVDTSSGGLRAAAKVAIEQSLKVRPGEQALIITNPAHDVFCISQALYDAALEAGGRPVMLVQPEKRQLDFAEDAVLAAFAAQPEVVISISAGKLGKDPKGIARPYAHDGKKYDHVFHLQQYGTKTCRAFWSPSVTLDSFVRTVPIDYELLGKRCGSVRSILNAARRVRVTAPGGTDITISLEGRMAKVDDGDYSATGSGGNLPAGETFVSPVNGSAQGVIAFDGSISLNDCDMVIERPIVCTVEGGYVAEIRGGEEALALRKTIALAEVNAREFELCGRLPPGSGAVYAKNARNIGEVGIGLNPAARIIGNMLEDEKAFGTCHFAIGQNYDDDAPTLIHLDGLVRNPTIIAYTPDECVIEKDGVFLV